MIQSSCTGIVIGSCNQVGYFRDDGLKDTRPRNVISMGQPNKVFGRVVGQLHGGPDLRGLGASND